MPRRIIVLGIMRSGTSLTAELIRRWGAYSGEENHLWKSDAQDPRGYGYMEYIPLQDLNDELLNHNDRIPPFDETLEEKAAEPEFREKALGLLRQMDQETVQNGFETWIWKDARLPLTLPFWTKLWEDPIYVITVRHPAEVVLSSAKTEGMHEEEIPFSAGLAYWQYCMLNILNFTQASRDKIFISYDQWLTHPLQECTRLCHFLNERTGKPAEGSPQQVETMVSQIAGNQRHYHYGKSLAEMAQATKEQRALYNFLRVKTLYAEEAFQPEDFAMYPGWREYLAAMDMLLSLSQSQ